MPFDVSAETLNRLDAIRDYAAMGGRQFVQTLMTLSGNAITRESDYLSNLAARNVVPPLEELLNQYYGGYLRFPDMARMAGYHGINLINAGPVDPMIARSWQLAVASRRPELSPELLRSLMWRGNTAARDQLTIALNKQGLRGSNHPEWFADWTPLPGMSVYVNLYRMTQQSRDELIANLRLYGYSEDDAKTISDTIRSVMGSGEAIGLYRLGVLSDFEVRAQLRANGFDDSGYQDWLLKGQYVPPGTGELLTAAGRNVWNDVFAQKWGLDDDKPRQYTVWAARQGLQYSAGTDAFGTAPTHDARTGDTGDQSQSSMFTWDKALWRGLWRLPSEAMLAEIIHRFRGNPDDSTTWSQPGYPPLRQSEIWEVLRANGLPTLSRNYWGRLVYRPIGLRQVKLMIQYGGWGQQEVSGALQDNGLSPVDADKVAAAYVASVNKPDADWLGKLADATHMRLIRDIEGAYKVGTLNAADATTALAQQQVPPIVSTQILAAADMEAATRLAATLITRTQSDVLAGRITIPQGQQRLINHNLDPARVESISQIWTAKLSEGRKQLATSKILQLLRKGLVTKSQAVARLDNLGWSRPDEILLLAEVQQEVAKDQAAAVKAVEAKVSGQERQLIGTLRSMQSTAGKLLSRLKTITPVASILDWYKDGLWSEQQVRDRLNLLGYPDDIVDTMILAKLGLPAGSPIPATNAAAPATPTTTTGG